MNLISKYFDLLLNMRTNQAYHSLFGRNISFWMHGENSRYKLSLKKLFGYYWITLYQEDCRFNYCKLISKNLTKDVYNELKELFDKRIKLDIVEKQNEFKDTIQKVLKS
jgi:hypothetical protein